MAKKRNKKVELHCCGEEESACGKDCKCNENKVEVYVCPKCQSVDVGYAFGIRNVFGIIPRMKCKKCGFEAMSFPKWIIDKDKLKGRKK